MQSHHATAGSHIRSGAKLLCETIYDEQQGIPQHQVNGARTNTDYYTPPEVLAGIFTALGSQTTLVRGLNFSPQPLDHS